MALEIKGFISRHAPTLRSWVGICLMSLLVTLIQYYLISPWEPALSYDTRKFYYPTQEEITQPNGNLFALLVTPFYRIKSDLLVQAHESKPVFVAALRLWGWLVHLINPSVKLPSNAEYMFFIMLTCGLLFISLWLVAKRFGYGRLGIIAGVITLISPWHLVFLYYPAYTELSIVFLLLAIALITLQTRAAILTAGILSNLALLTNNASIVYIVGLSILIVYFALPDLGKAFRLFSIFTSAFLGIFIALKAFSYSPYIVNLLGSNGIDTPIEILYRYYLRSYLLNNFEKLDTPKYIGIMLIFLNYNSKIILATFLLAPFVFTWNLAKHGLQSLWQDTILKQVLAIALTSIIGILAIDLRPGVQLGRTYFIGYPLLVLSILILFTHLLKNFRYRGIVIISLTSLYIIENVFGLMDQRAAFHSAGAEIARLAKQGKQIVIFENDGQREAILTNSELYCQCGIEKQIKLIDNSARYILPTNLENTYLITGPRTGTIYPTEGFIPIPVDNLLEKLKQQGIHATLSQNLPSWQLYPLLLFEDETQTWRLITREITFADYLNGSGTIKIWKLSAVQP